MLNNLLSRSLSKFGLKISKITQATTAPLNLPYEIGKEEVDLIQSILRPDNPEERLSMVSGQRLWAAISSVKYVIENDIPGDIVECGVWRGGCSLAMAKTIQAMNSNKKVYMYDTFTGMTKPDNNDIAVSGQIASETYENTERSDDYFWCFSSLQDVKKRFAEADLLSHTVFVPGDVENTLCDKECGPSSISVLRLDTDWYASTKKELDVLYPRLSPFGILLVDDYGHWQGSRKAVDEYFANEANRPKPMQWVTDYTGRGFVKVPQTNP